MQILFVLFSLALMPVHARTNLLHFGDSGQNNIGQRKVREAMIKFCEEETCDLGVLAGDNVYPGGVRSAKDRILVRVFDEYYNPLNMQILVAMGNHDYGLLGYKWWRGKYQLAHSKKNPLFHLPHYWYVHETADAVIAVIDTARMMWGKNMLEQAKMVAEAHKRSLAAKKWFIVVGHHPYLSNGGEGNAGNYLRLKRPFFMAGKYVKQFLDQYVCGKAQLYLSGHDHSLQIIDGNVANCNTKLIVSGSAAETSILTNRNPVIWQALKRGFVHLRIGPSEIFVKAVDEKSTVLYEGKILP